MAALHEENMHQHMDYSPLPGMIYDSAAEAEC